MKTFDLKKYGTMDDWSCGYAEPWNTLTVNLDSACPRDCAYIDTNNNDEDILAWIARHGLATPTGRYGSSGYCRYPEYRFRPETLQELDPDGYSEYLHGYEERIAGKRAKCP